MEDRPSFAEALEHLINSYSQENESNTPDFILAEYLLCCLDIFNKAVQNREQWYGRKPELTNMIEEPKEKK